MIRVFVALGSNLADPVTQAQLALQAMARIPNTAVVQRSPLYWSKPLGPQDQPDFLNGVVELSTTLSPQQLLTHLQAIEQTQGRVRHERWGARTLDLDILTFGDQIICTPELTVPHYAMKERLFVLSPLQVIAPDYHFPDGTSIEQALAALADNTPLIPAE